MVTQFHRAAVERMLTFAATVWFGTETAEEEKELTKFKKVLLSEICMAKLQGRGPLPPRQLLTEQRPRSIQARVEPQYVHPNIALCMILLLFFF